MFKKITSIALCLVLALTVFTACGNKPADTSSSTAAPVETQLTGTLEEIMTKIYDGVKSELPKTMNTPITAENSMYFVGLENLDNVEEALASEAMINAVAHSVCLIKVKDGADIEAIKTQIKENVDPRKWICVGVSDENVRVENIGNTILLVMDEEASQEFVDSFLALK
ncbi:MAG: hypothetical protein RR902_01220 [Oscillospiraceae bacterium]